MLVSLMAAGLAGCSIGSGRSVSDAVEDFKGPDIRAQAEAIPYATLDMRVAGNGGLVVLAARAGDATYWQFNDGTTVSLADGYLAATAGLDSDLVSTRVLSAASQPLTQSPWTQPKATSYRIVREWRDAEGYTHHGEANARLHCDADVSQRSLPLTTRALQRCVETLAWDSGDSTRSELWRDPRDFRLWAVKTQPWPDAPTIAWDIARPW